MDRPDPLRLGKYRVLEAVARGPLAEVLKARLDGIAGFSRLFAIKRVHEAIAADPARLARIEAEVRRAAVLSHGNVVQVLDLGRDADGRPYVVLEWVDGWSLATVLARAREAGTPLPLPHAAWIALQVLNALEVAHGHRERRGGAEVDAPLLHGALGPEDVLLSRGGEVKVSDFGLAHVATELAAAVPGLIPGARPTAPPSVAGDLRDVARVFVACLTLADAPAPLGARADVPARLARAVDALLGAEPAAPADAATLKDAVVDALHGVVFTQEDLAAWVKSLLGVGDAVSDDLRLDVDAADDLIDEELGLDPALDVDLPDLPAKDDWTAPEDAHGGGRTLHDEDDDVRTIVQGMAPRPSATASVVAAHGVGEVTGSVLAGLGGPSHAASPPPTDAPWEAPGAAVVDPDLAARLAELRRARPAAPTAWKLPDDDTTAAPRRPWLAGAAAAIVLLAVGGGLGVVGAGVQGRALGLTTAPPVLDLHVPGGLAARVQVDDAPVSGPVTLTAGPHRVRVEADGVDPWTFELTLAEGEYRVMVIDAPRRVVADATPTAPE